MSGGENEERPPLGTGGAQENGDSDPCKVNSNIPGIDGTGEGEGLLPCKDAVREALRLIHPEGPWHVSAKREKGFTGKVYTPDAEGGAAGWAVAQNRTLNAYVSIAALRPGWNGDKATKADVGSVGWLWVDLDPRPGEELETERARILALLTTNLPKGVPPPSVIIDSGRGFWGLWRLVQPVVMPPADDPAWDAARASVEDRNRGLELAFGADACHNMERVMRLPGTVNRKPGGRLARVVRADASVFDLLSFPAVPDPKVGAAVVVAGRGAPVLATDLPAVPFGPDGRPDLPVSDRTKMLIVQGRDPDDPGRYKSRSEAFWAVVCDLARADVSDDLIAAVVLNPDFAISGHPLDQPKSRQYVVRQIGRARAEAANDPKAGMEKDDNGNVKRNQRNIRQAMVNLGISIRRDTFAGRTLIEGLEGFGPALDDGALNRLWLLAEERCGVQAVNQEFFQKVLEDLAYQNRFDPVADYLDGLTWDGVPRLDNWLTTYGGAEENDYTRAVGALLLVAAVRRVRKPGAKFDEMLVLQSSAQGTDKSSAIKALAGDGDLFGDDLPLNVNSAEVLELTEGKWIVEVAELKGMRKNDIEHLKSFLSKTSDKGRRAWRKLPEEVPRRFVFFGTTNEDRFLRDTTGNRRFWPVRIVRFDVAAIRRDRDQLWAEASLREAAGAKIRLDESLWRAAEEAQTDRMVEDPIFDRLSDLIGGDAPARIAGSTVWDLLGKVQGHGHQEDNARVGDAMRRLGFVRTKVRTGLPNPVNGYERGKGGVLLVVRREGDFGTVTGVEERR